MGILPPPQKDGEIKFFIAKGLPYRPRMALFALLLAAGFGLQVAFGFWSGYPLLLLGMLLAANAGYDSSPRPTGEEKWERVTPDEYAKIKLRAGELKKWDDDFFDVTSGTGQFCLALTCAAAAIGYAVAAFTWDFPEGSWVFFGLDAAVLILPLWLIGTREYLKKDRLVIKIDQLEAVMAELKADSGLQVSPMLALLPTAAGGSVPEDARLMVKLVGAPEALYGVQVQLSVNSVQGKDFPYLYCVVLAKAGSGLLAGWERFAEQPPESPLLAGIFRALTDTRLGGMDYEPGRSGDVDIIVVRQHTTRQSGYHTPPAAAMNVVNFALRLARGLAAANAPK